MVNYKKIDYYYYFIINTIIQYIENLSLNITKLAYQIKI